MVVQGTQILTGVSRFSGGSFLKSGACFIPSTLKCCIPNTWSNHSPSLDQESRSSIRHVMIEAHADHGKGQDGDCVVTGHEKSSPTPSPSPSPSPPPPLPPLRLFIVIGALCLGTFLFGLDLNIIGVAIPPITTEFRSLADVAWYGSAYMLTVTAFQPLFGNLNKFFNAKIVYMISLSIFEGMYDKVQGNGKTIQARVASLICTCSGINHLGSSTRLRHSHRWTCYSRSRGSWPAPGSTCNHRPCCLR